MPHMTKSIVLNNDGQNEIQMPAILIVQVLKKKINKLDAVEMTVWISDFLRDGKI